jgi:hypothetical protein
MASVLLLLVVVVGCGGSQSGQQQGQDQVVEQTTQESTFKEQTEEEIAPVSKLTADRQYAGRVEGTGVFIGIAVRDGRNGYKTNFRL